MNVKRVSKRTRSDVPYDAGNKAAIKEFWSGATKHKGLTELRVKRGNRPKRAHERK